MPQQEQFIWKCHPEAEKFVLNVVDECVEKNSAIKTLQEQLLTHSSTRLFDWLDHVAIAATRQNEQLLLDTGFECDHATASYRLFYHPGAQLPRVALCDDGDATLGLAVKVDSIEEFLMVRGNSAPVEGSFFSPYRRCLFNSDNGVSTWVVERRSTFAIEPVDLDDDAIESYLEAKQLWQCRPRNLADEEEAMALTIQKAEAIVKMVGRDMAAWIILEVERAYWQAKNSAARQQKNRQDTLGLGWANHDHHTFRSSRHLFVKLVRLFEMVGFHCRERFYAGQEAGWGAQVMENRRCGLVLFLDVDLSADEIAIDFAHQRLPTLPKLGTIGLWCALHGDSILKAGMHHLEAQFMFDELKEDLSQLGVSMMDPFSNFGYLKQAFTKGEVWPVDHARIDKLLAQKMISDEQAVKFAGEGALGSHLENLQRREGYKGFNQKNVSCIIRKTDPRQPSTAHLTG